MTSDEYFYRQIALWGKPRQDALEDKKVVIIGAGGLGSSVGMALSGSGIGQIDVVDFDSVSPHNIHRQIAFKLGDEGRFKADLLRDIMKSRNPFVKSNAFILDFHDFDKIICKYDLVIDCTDNLASRAKIDSYAKERNIAWVYGSVEAFHGQVCLFEQAKFDDFFVITDRKPAGIAAPMVMQIAAFQANLALRYLTGLEVASDTLHYFYFDKTGTLELKKFKANG